MKSDVSISDIDAGREPAQTMLQIASAVRQDTAGAGARLYSLRLILDGESIYGPVDLPDETRAALTNALDGLSAHLRRVEEKLSLAVEAERRNAYSEREYALMKALREALAMLTPKQAFAEPTKFDALYVKTLPLDLRGKM